ncbi:potassium channel family protein [Atribacter laminatus]|uniref:Potassium channel domain-containing protein n=1 Tax=Atribacter laminatus TaxID=2847778 RepID=A0A7T1ALP8_ATRLM|nr:pentapeptide repeat-containing protein [Atribacter laminatus]QPM68211.1 hypothetical protein RT761_01426 [Atribacter laminatus]
MEEKKGNQCPICGRPSLYTSTEGKCIFHAKAEEKDEDEFKEELRLLLKDKNFDFNFNGFVFIGDIDFNRDYNIKKFINASFEKAVFNGKMTFYDIQFNESTSFDDTVFYGESYFIGSHFNGYTAFFGIIFSKKTSFDGTKFNEKVDFYFVYFYGETIFTEVRFEKGAIFDNVEFNQYGNFFDTHFSEGTNFSNIFFQGNINFTYAYLENVNMSGIFLSDNTQVCFNGTRLRNTWIIKGNIEKHIQAENEKKYGEARETYLLLKNNFHSIGRYEDESWAFKKEKDMERKDFWEKFCKGKNYEQEEIKQATEESKTTGKKNKREWKYFKNWLCSWFINLLYGYGERPGNVIIVSGGIILLFTFLYTYFGIVDNLINNGTSKNIFNCLYFSIVTFTTLGFGDLSPQPIPTLRLLTSIEAFIGAFMMALFIYTFARRTGGR